ncbi:MAG: S-layer homology domain-containing protein, partial [Thermosediminibacteraceae bacterium]|nr:S-layer homology domain-containing protein [Thermosediminibacteraceae bacterium]
SLVVLVFVLSTVSVGFAAVDETSPSVVRAKALGILKGDEKGNLNLDKPITRAEAITLIVRILGLEKSADLMKGQTQFKDVPATHWATGYINLGFGQGIINGYPDGTFKPNNNVTYAEVAKMLLYAMNYGVTVEGTPWPAGVMGKADDLGIFEGVNAVPNVPALRGDVVEIIDNCLTIKHLKQIGYGDLKQYIEGDETFLSKMKVKELKDYTVTKIAKVDSKLDADEVVLEKGAEKGIYKLIADVNPEAIFGLKVDAWVNDDDQIFFVNVKTKDEDKLIDTVVIADSNLADDELYLKNQDDDYEVADNATLYVNFEPVDVEELEDYDTLYGRIVLDKGEIVFANLFSFEGKGFVTKVEDDVIEYVDLVTADDEELELDDYDEIYVYNKDFTAAKVEDIDEDSLIYYWENDDDELFIIVAGEKVTGEVEKLKADRLTVDGKTYKKAGDAVVTLDNGDSYKVWAGLNDVSDLTDEEVTLILDYNGEIAVVLADAETTSDTIYGIVTYAKLDKTGVVSVFTKDGKVVDYTAEKRTDVADLVDDENYFGTVDGTGQNALKYAIIGFQLNSDGEIAEGTIAPIIEVNGDTVVQTVYGKTLNKAADKDYVYVGTTDSSSNRYYITKDTVIMKALNSDGELDPAVISYDDLVEMSLTSEKAVVIGDAGKNAKMIVFLEPDFEGIKDDIYFGVVVDSPWKVGSNYVATIDVAGEGEKEFTVANRVYFDKGTLIAFKLNSKNKAEWIVYDDINNDPADVLNDGDDNKVDEAYIIVDTVKAVDGSFIETDDEGTFKVASDAVIYNIKYDGSKWVLGDKIRLSKIDKGDEVSLLLNKDGIVKAIVVRYAEDLQKAQQ